MLVLLLHVAALLVLRNHIVFRAITPTEEQVPFQLVKIAPPAAPVPEPPQQVSIPLPMPAAPPLATITTNVPAPKFDVPMPKISIKLANLPSAPTPTLPGNTEVAYKATSYSSLSQILQTSTHGKVLGICACGSQLASDVNTVDDIRRKLLTVVGWDIGKPFVDVAGIKYGSDVPSVKEEMMKFPEQFSKEDNIEDGLRSILNSRAWEESVEALVVVWDYKGKNDEGNHPQAADILVQRLRDKKIRLCVILFGNSLNPSDAPTKVICDYINESGGAILYADEVSTDTVANQLTNGNK